METKTIETKHPHHIPSKNRLHFYVYTKLDLSKKLQRMTSYLLDNLTCLATNFKLVQLDNFERIMNSTFTNTLKKQFESGISMAQNLILAFR